MSYVLDMYLNDQLIIYRLHFFSEYFKKCKAAKSRDSGSLFGGHKASSEDSRRVSYACSQRIV